MTLKAAAHLSIWEEVCCDVGRFPEQSAEALPIMWPKINASQSVRQVQGPSVNLNNRLLEHPKVLRGAKGPLLIVRWAYYAFIFSIPFESVDIGIKSGSFSLSKMVGYAFIASAILQPHLCFRYPPKAFWWFAIYLSVYVSSGILQESGFIDQMMTRLLSLVQMLILFWMSYNLMHHNRVTRGTLLTLAASCIVLAVLMAFGVTSKTIAQGRVTTLGENANTVAVVLSFGLLSVLGLAYGLKERKDISRVTRLLVWPCFGILTIAIIYTGSRTAVVALMIGLMVFSLQGRSLSSRLKIGLVSLVAIGLLIHISYQYEPARIRWSRTLETGSLAHREYIFPMAWKMFQEKPLTGWGPINHTAELGFRLGSPDLDTHNLYLWILTETGLLGSLPFFGGLWLCWHAAWKARSGFHGALPMAMVLCLFVLNMAGTWYNLKLFWVVLAYTLASESHIGLPRFRKGPLQQNRAWKNRPVIRVTPH